MNLRFKVPGIKGSPKGSPSEQPSTHPQTMTSLSMMSPCFEAGVARRILTRDALHHQFKRGASEASLTIREIILAE